MLWVQILQARRFHAASNHQSLCQKNYDDSLLPQKAVFLSHIQGFNALSNNFESDMIESGIVDPTKVVRSALENAASASGTLLTTEVTISLDEDKD